jgi:hypothetical protein
MNKDNSIYFRSIHGGKPIIGKGLEGIVLKPDIKHHKDNYITKLFILPRDITIDKFIELEININTFDSLNQYHLPMIDIERINETHNLTELEYDDRTKYKYIATYEFGGLSLTNLTKNPIYEPIMTPSFCIKILNGFINLFNGIIHFSSKGITHNDIHQGNIVFVLDNPSMMRFIDFNNTSVFRRFNSRYIQDIIDTLITMKEIILKFTDIYIGKKNEMFTLYLQSILPIVNNGRTTLLENDDINDIPIIVQRLKEKLDEIKPMISEYELKNTIRQSVKAWWNKSSKDYATVDELLNNTTNINGYTFLVTSGHRAFVNAIKNGSEISIIDCGAPDTPREFKDTLIQKLNEMDGGRKKRKTLSKKSIKSRKSAKPRFPHQGV